ncbi:hypothetical protein JCM10914A_42200 [Paenibacillus sp. JCM 10914]|uniref:hypothetical protein n=1 Tax=Paenibacillus sp. JCM 10914 TaxID=1236974 RepID=UPI0003CC8DA3|nr:hypothetical protein [Paenibacillus sp. JCM 10914]GAE05436.1 hypothetical protein JCM10914_1537 [Paenibacillus sp. JCM 10914]
MTDFEESYHLFLKEQKEKADVRRYEMLERDLTGPKQCSAMSYCLFLDLIKVWS